MIKFYYHPSPNPAKVALFLKEAAVPYEIVPVDTRKSEQFRPSYLAINPNAKTPTIVDGDTTMFDSNAILLYLAEKTSKFLPTGSAAVRAELLSWLMFIASGIGPYSGQAVHFKHFAPQPQEYGLKRYAYEAARHWGILDKRLAGQQFVVGNSYSIADMAFWGWARAVPFILGESAWTRLPNVKRLLDEVSARPAAARAESLKNRFAFKTEMDDEARRNLFPQMTAA